jgi:hypothetical protein
MLVACTASRHPIPISRDTGRTYLGDEQMRAEPADVSIKMSICDVYLDLAVYTPWSDMVFVFFLIYIHTHIF